MKNILLITLLVVGGLFTTDLYAQNGRLFDADHLMPSSFTNQVFIDRDGFVWVATRNGLARYDGYQARLFKKELGDGLASNYVNCIGQDGSGLIYLGMYGALQTYDGNQFHDVRVKDLDGMEVPCYVTCIVCRRSGQVLLGTSGHGIIMMDSPTEAHQLGGDLANFHTVEELMEDSGGRLWIITQEGELLLCTDGEVTERYFGGEAGQIHANRICEDGQGQIYVGTGQHGVMRLEDGAFRHIAATGNKRVTALYRTRDGNLMIGYDGMGVGILNPATDIVTDNPYYSQQVDLSLAKVVSIVEDPVGNIWLGMLQKGIYMQPASTDGFGYMGRKLGERNSIGQACVTSTLIDSKGHTWVGTDKDGLYLLDKDHRLLHHFRENFPQTILTLCEDRQGRIWMGSYNEGCGYIDRNRELVRIEELRHVNVFGLASDGEGNVWMGTMGQGLLRLSPDGSIKAYTMQEDAVRNEQANSLVNNYISKLSTSPDGKRIYVATTMGMCCLEAESESWTATFGKNCLNYGTPIRMAREFDGVLWIGTNDGLLRYDLRAHELRGAGNFPGVAGMESDPERKLWLSTDHGLCRFDPATEQTESYFVDNGLQSNEFSDGASSLSADGQMVFGGVGGITWFDPAKIRQPQWNATVRLVAFIVNSQPVNIFTKSGSYAVCDTTVTACDRFQLSYSENHFSIQLSTLTYDNAEHITYLYSINGEPYTRLPQGVNELTFSHLSPGNYHFRVKAERNNQQTTERAFTVVVHSPWWRTWWAYCLYAMAVCLAVWQYLLNRRRKEQVRLRLQEHIHAEELGEAKLRFFINISHEIRTPMTLILTPLLSLIKNETDPHRRGIYETIRRNAERILSLINQIMDLRKIDKGMMQMRMQQTDLIGFVEDIHSLFEHQARARQIHFTFRHEDESLPVWIDRQQFDKVIVNILSNAFKFTPINGNICIDVSQEEGKFAVISISDDGEQIPEEKLKRIFERFYQSPSTVNDRNTGTGIGLDLTRSLVELHHGTITAGNMEKGCRFTVTIPLGNAHLKPEEIMPEKGAEASLKQWVEEELNTEVLTETKMSGRPTMVVAEDDDEIRNYLERELSADYAVRVCRNGREALTEILRQSPDLVITDVMMPEMDGNALCTTLKANQQTAHIPVILLTAKSRDEDQLRGLETGADAYIVKPFNMDILRRTILNLIHSRHQLRLKYERNEQLEQRMEDISMRSPDDKLLDNMMRVINANISNFDLNVDFLAREVGISRVHLHRKMKELTGQTPHDFIRNLRLKQAANLLSSGDMNITEVVYACGFSNVPSFSTTFKKFYGMTPREYMQEHQKY